MEIAVEPMRTSLDPKFVVKVKIDVPDSYIKRLLQKNPDESVIIAAIVRAYKRSPTDLGDFVFLVRRTLDVLDEIDADVAQFTKEKKDLETLEGTF